MTTPGRPARARPYRGPPPNTPPRPQGDNSRPEAGDQIVDLVVAVVLILGAAWVAWVLPEGDMLRLVIAAPIVLVVPGYLVLQAVFVPARPPRQRLIHVLFAVGLSPVILGLLALTTALVPSGFRTGPIVAVVTVACLALAGLAGYRRAADRRGGSEGRQPPPVQPPNPGGRQPRRR